MDVLNHVCNLYLFSNTGSALQQVLSSGTLAGQQVKVQTQPVSQPGVKTGNGHLYEKYTDLIKLTCQFALNPPNLRKVSILFWHFPKKKLYFAKMQTACVSLEGLIHIVICSRKH